MRGNETLGRIVTNFCTGVGVHDVITSANFYDCRLWGLNVVGVKVWVSTLTRVIALTTFSHYRASVWNRELGVTVAPWPLNRLSWNCARVIMSPIGPHTHNGVTYCHSFFHHTVAQSFKFYQRQSSSRNSDGVTPYGGTKIQVMYINFGIFDQ